MNVHLPQSVRTQAPLQTNLGDVSPSNNALIHTLTEIITNLTQGTITPFDAGKEIEALISPLYEDMPSIADNIFDICSALETNPPPSPTEIVGIAGALLIYRTQIEDGAYYDKIPFSDLAAGYLNYESSMIRQTGQYDATALLTFLQNEVDSYSNQLPTDIVNMLDSLEYDLRFGTRPPAAETVADDLAQLRDALHNLAHPSLSTPSGLENNKLALRVASAVHGLN